MIFTGEYEHSIDAKQRVAVPAEIRKGLDPDRDGSAFYLVIGPNEAPWLWPERTFVHLAESMGSSLLGADEVLEFERLLYSQSHRLDIDNAGRIRLPARTLAHAGITSAVVIIGVRDHLELYEPGAWEAMREQHLVARQSEIMLKARRAMEGARDQERRRDA